MFSFFPRTRLVSRAATLVAAVVFALAPTAHAQSAYYAGVTTTVGSGFTSPVAVAVDGYGNVFVADSSLVQEIEAGTGGAAPGTVNSSSTVIQVGSGFSSVQGVAVDHAGNVYVADSGSGKVYEIEAGTGGAVAGTVNTSSTVIRFGSFSQPDGLAFDGVGDLYVADTGVAKVYEIVAGTGSAAAGTVNGSSTVNPLAAASAPLMD